MFQKTLDEGMAGDNVGVLLRGVEKNDLERGQVVCKPGSITPHTKFEAEVYVLSKEEGGRHTPFFTGYRPQFYFRTTDVTGSVLNLLSEDDSEAEMCMPGDNIKMTVELHTPDRHGGEPPLRHPRRRQDRRRRRRDQDPSVTMSPTAGRVAGGRDPLRRPIGRDPGRLIGEPVLGRGRSGESDASLTARGAGRCANTSGWNAPRAGTGTTGPRRRPGAPTGWS